MRILRKLAAGQARVAKMAPASSAAVELGERVGAPVGLVARPVGLVLQRVGLVLQSDDQPRQRAHRSRTGSWCWQ